MDFSIILVGGHALRKSVLNVSTKHVKMIFFSFFCVCVPLSSHSLRYKQIHIWLVLNLFAVPSSTWKMTRVTINTKCLKQHLTTLSTGGRSPGLKLLLQGQKNMYPRPEVEHRQRAAAASISWKLSSWLFLIWSWCLQWKQNRRPNHIGRITSFYPQEM